MSFSNSGRDMPMRTPSRRASVGTFAIPDDLISPGSLPVCPEPSIMTAARHMKASRKRKERNRSNTLRITILFCASASRFDFNRAAHHISSTVYLFFGFRRKFLVDKASRSYPQATKRAHDLAAGGNLTIFRCRKLDKIGRGSDTAAFSRRESLPTQPLHTRIRLPQVQKRRQPVAVPGRDAHAQ